MLFRHRHRQDCSQVYLALKIWQLPPMSAWSHADSYSILPLSLRRYLEDYFVGGDKGSTLTHSIRIHEFTDLPSLPRRQQELNNSEFR